MKRTKEQLFAGVQHVPQRSSEIGQETSFKPEFKATRWSKGFYTCPETKIIWKEIS